MRCFATITMCCVVLLECEEQVLFPEEQQLDARMYTYFGLNACDFQHMRRMALRALATTSPPLRGDDLTGLACLSVLARLDVEHLQRLKIGPHDEFECTTRTERARLRCVGYSCTFGICQERYSKCESIVSVRVTLNSLVVIPIQLPSFYESLTICNSNTISCCTSSR